MPQRPPDVVPEIVKGDLSEELLQVCYRVRETMDGKGDIFIDAGSPWRTHGADGWDDAFSRFPKRDLLDGVICKIGIM